MARDSFTQKLSGSNHIRLLMIKLKIAVEEHDKLIEIIQASFPDDHVAFGFFMSNSDAIAEMPVPPIIEKIKSNKYDTAEPL